MFEKQEDHGFTEIISGVNLKTLVYGNKSLMIEARFKKGAVIPPHSHPQEQTGYIVSGQMIFTVAGEQIEVQPGDSWNIHGDVEHSATAIEESVVIEVFSPVREDYMAYYKSEG